MEVAAAAEALGVLRQVVLTKLGVLEVGALSCFILQRLFSSEAVIADVKYRRIISYSPATAGCLRTSWV